MKDCLTVNLQHNPDDDDWKEQGPGMFQRNEAYTAVDTLQEEEEECMDYSDNIL